MRPSGFAIIVAAGLLSRIAAASTSLVVPAGGGLGGLAVAVDVTGKVVRYASCSAVPCAASPSSPTLPIPVEDATIDPKRVSIHDVAVGGGRHLAHVRVGLGNGDEAEAPAWEALLVSGSPPLFAGVTGWNRGEAGERTGVDLRLLPDGERTAIIAGDIREDLRICGDDATLLDPRGLDPRTMIFHGATLQRLSQERRDAAIPLEATRHRGPEDPPLAPLLRATEASSALASAPAGALTDGDPATAWSEGRSGRGQGEFVLLRMPFDVPVARFAIKPAPTTPTATDSSRVAPQTFFLATAKETYAITLPEDASSHPGDAYDITLPEPLTSSCVALVLADAFTRGKPHPDVSVAELTAYSTLDRPGTTLSSLAAALTGGDARAVAAAGILEQAGEPGIAAIAAAYPTLDPAGRALAMNVAASAASCATSATLFAAALVDPDEVVRAKAKAKLGEQACGREALPALVLALKSEVARAKVAPLVAFIGREEALRLLAGWLGEGGESDRQVLRAAVGYASRRASPEDLDAVLESSAKRSPAASLDALRALRDRLPEVATVANASVSALDIPSAPFDVRYDLVDIVSSLAASRDPSSQRALEHFTFHDAAPEVRARGAERLSLLEDPLAAAPRALEDRAPRVREATLLALRDVPHATATAAMLGLLARDPWTFVRVAAAEALAGLPGTSESDRALAASLAQLSPRVREKAILALGAHRATAYRDAVRHRFTDPKEDLAVRAAAANALGSLCDTRAVDDLTHGALVGATSADPTDVALGLVATDALGVLHPKDLAARFKPLESRQARPDARSAAARALQHPASCPLP